MCGIAGFSWYNASTDAALSLALHAMSHRGLDDSGLFEDDSSGVGLARGRLSIVDLSPLGHQPMASPDKSLVLVFNG